jgi:hypothetical protein
MIDIVSVVRYEAHSSGSPLRLTVILPVVRYDEHSTVSPLRLTALMPIVRQQLYITQFSILYVHRNKIVWSRGQKKHEMIFTHINIGLTNVRLTKIKAETKKY